MNKPNLNKAHKAAIKAAISASKIVEKYFVEQGYKTEIKSDNSPVTEADFASSREILNILSETEIPILSEEEKQSSFEERKNWSQLWIVDPLDGTKEFIKGTDEFCVNIGLVENGKPVFGVIAHPVSKSIYFGGKGKGAWKYNFEKEKVENALKLPLTLTPENKLIVQGGKDTGTEFYEGFNHIKKKYAEVEFQKLSSALKFCSIAEGKADIYPRNYPCMEWDTASGHAIVQGVGKDLYDKKTGEVITYNMPDLHTPYFILT